MGGPPGDYRRGPRVYDADGPVVPGWQAGDKELSLAWPDQWRGDRLLIAVAFDDQGKVQAAFGLRPAPPAWYREVQGWLPFLR